jgi:hypothetical protein
MKNGMFLYDLFINNLVYLWPKSTQKALVESDFFAKLPIVNTQNPFVHD